MWSRRDEHLKIDGAALERWFLKTLINIPITLGDPLRIGPKSVIPGNLRI
jgi:hypothetical protein